MRFCLLLLGLGWSWMAGPVSEAQEPTKESSKKAGEVVIKPVSLEVKDLGKIEFELGTLSVPENRAEKKSRLIGVGFARFKAKTKTNAPPIFLLPGGPGNSLLNGLKPNQIQPEAVKRLLQLQAISDVVIVDQRGFSEHGDRLQYQFRTPEEPLDQPASLEKSTKAFTEMAHAAIKEFDKKEIDLRGYTVKECAEDVNDLRQALEYDRITLYGSSFGSQWSFAILRQYPDRVARALLSGIEPLDCGYDMPSHVWAAVQRIWWEAEKDKRLKPYLPSGGLCFAAQEVVQKLAREPIRVTLKGVTDSKTGKAITITLGHEDFQKAPVLRGVGGPAFVLSLYHGHYDQWASTTNFARRSRTIEFPLIAPLIDTSLGVTPRRRYLMENDPATKYLGRWNFDNYLATADIWPSPDVGDDFRTEVVCQVPVVFVQGDWDTQTPVENVLQVAPYFRKGHVLLVERGGHGVLNQIAQHLPKTQEALFEFLKTGSIQDLPTRISVPAPKFDIPNFSLTK